MFKSLGLDRGISFKRYFLTFAFMQLPKYLDIRCGIVAGKMELAFDRKLGQG